MSYEKHDIIDFSYGVLTLEGKDYSGNPVKIQYQVNTYDLGDISLDESSEDLIIRSGSGPVRIVEQGPVKSLDIKLNVLEVIENDSTL